MAECEMCGKEFKQRVSHHATCSKACVQAKARRLYFTNNPDKAETAHLNTGNVGAMHELMVCCDLLKRGYEVFRAISQSSLFDVAAFKDGKLIRVEVTTGAFSTHGKLAHPTKDFSRFDLLAVVTGRGIEYTPPIGEVLGER